MEEPVKELDDEAEEALEDDNSESDDDGDGKEPSGESFQSQDTPRRGGELGNTSDDSEDESYDPNKPSDAAEGSTELELSSEEEDDESIDFEEIQQLCNANAEWNEAHERDAEVAGPSTAPGINAVRILEPHEVHTNINDGTVHEDGTIASVFTASEEEWQHVVPDSVVGVVDIAEVGAVHMLGERTKAETRVSIEAEAPNLEVLGTTAAAHGTQLEGGHYQYILRTICDKSIFNWRL
jgi:hypothetical protein